MALRDQPYLPLYIQDFLTDEKLAECSASATGVYIRLMCLMHKSSIYGKILLKQKYKQTDEQILNFASMIAKNLLYDLQTVVDGLSELVSEGVLQVEGDFLIQKRMVKDNEISEKRAFAGKNGGKKTQKNVKSLDSDKNGFASNFAKANNQANTEYEYENEIQEEKGGVGEKEGKKSDHFPNQKTEFELTETEIGSCIEFCRLTSKLIWKPPEVVDKFSAFKIQNFTGKQFYESRSDILKHFRDWLKLQKQEQNGRINGFEKSNRGKVSDPAAPGHVFTPL